MMKIGPFDILPGDSIKIVFAEIVDGVDYDKAINPKKYSANSINTESRDKFFATADRAQNTYNNHYNHTDPPAAPEFEVDYNRVSGDVANVLTWGTDAELIPDPDKGTVDLKSYIIYRSSYLPIGPWTAIDTILVGDNNYFDGISYRFIDKSVDIGQAYYYAITGIDSDNLESSLFANRLNNPFIATLPPKDNLDEILVVPNPFVIGKGFSQPGVKDKIQFVNIPNPCTIRIYTVRGDLVKTIRVDEGEGAIVSWDQVTDFGQFVESGIYLFHVESKGKTKIGKFAIVR